MAEIDGMEPSHITTHATPFSRTCTTHIRYALCGFGFNAALCTLLAREHIIMQKTYMLI